MSKKKRWFNKGIWGGAVDVDLFSNSIQQHSQKLKQQKLLDDDGFEILPEDDYGYSSYSWDLDKKLIGDGYKETGNKKEDRANKYEIAKNDYGNAYNTYEKTGVWRGYHYQPKLSYKYVQQMANILSVKHNVKVQIGNHWQVDLIKKVLTYNPASLIYGTKSELLATLMHEIGKLRYVTHSSLLNNKYLAMYKLPAMEVLNIYEDLRTDFLMLKAYEGAAEIYESVIPVIEQQVKDYMHKGRMFREIVEQIPQTIYQQIINQHTYNMPNHLVNANDPQLKDQLLRTFGTSDLQKVQENMQILRDRVRETGTIYEYCGEILSVMYDLDDQRHQKFANLKEKIEQTIPTIEPSKKSINSQALVDFLDTEVYPKIEDLLKDMQNKSDAIDKAFPQMPENVKKNIQQQIQNAMQGMENMQGGGMDSNGNMKVRNSQGLSKNGSTIPAEWYSGDYKTLKDSVEMEIKQLVNRLTFLRREELTVRYTSDQKRGRLNAKKLYKISHGSRRLFKQRLENTDTIQSFAFSILLDVSGSMNGPRITHSTRGLIILAEVFKKLEIPFEITTFSDGIKNIKPFISAMDKKMERSIGGLVNNYGGGTDLDRGLKVLKIHDQSEKNKIVIVLTDGDVGGAKHFDDKFFIPWSKKGIKSIGIGLECGNQVKDLCMGNSRALSNASELPVEFSNILKELIRR